MWGFSTMEKFSPEFTARSDLFTRTTVCTHAMLKSTFHFTNIAKINVFFQI